MTDIKKLVESQRDYFHTHTTKSYEFRKTALLNLHKAIKEHEAEIFEALKTDLNKCRFEAFATEIGFVLEEISHALKNLKDWMRVKKVTTPTVLHPASSLIYSDPLGVILIIAPWNYPFQLTLSPLVGAIAGGNTCIIKPSEFSSATSAVINKIIAKTFRPEYLAVVQGAIKETQELLALKFDHILFTGSTAVGKIVMKAASEYLTPVTLELGGKSPCIVEADANLEITAKRIAWGKFLNAGQTCVSPDYILVQKSAKEQLVNELKKAFDGFVSGNAQESPDYTRIINERHFERLEGLKSGGKIIHGGASDKGEKFLEITLLDDINLEHPLMKEEIFGPLLPIITYDDLDDAIRFINERPKPLAIYVFSESEEAQQKTLSLTSSGSSCINETVYQFGSTYLPIGGVGESGMGSYHGEDTFKTFTHQKSVFKRGFWPDIALRYAPYKDKDKFLRLFFK
jgi:aldehyde dehydrogenase (NAD+)